MSAWCLVLTPFSLSPLSFSISLPEVSFDIPLGCPSGEKHPHAACNLWSIPPQRNSARHTSCNFDHIWNAPCLKDTCLLTETQQHSPISQFRFKQISSPSFSMHKTDDNNTWIHKQSNQPHHEDEAGRIAHSSNCSLDAAAGVSSFPFAFLHRNATTCVLFAVSLITG